MARCYEVLLNGGLLITCADKRDAERHAQFHTKLAKDYGRRCVVIVRAVDLTETNDLFNAAMAGAEVYDGNG